MTTPVEADAWAAAAEATPAATGPALVFASACAVMETPRPIEIVEGMAWAGHLSVLVSESGTGKTFVLLDIAAAVSAGVRWHGRETLQGSVAYCSYEGDALGLRLRALRDHGGHLLEHVYFVRAYEPLSPRVTRDGEERSIGESHVMTAIEALAGALAATGKPAIRLLVIDTVRASLAGSEDSSEHVSAYLRAVRRISAQVPTAAIVLAHHAGWQDGDTQRKRERGSSAWRGNCDGTLYLEAGDYHADRGEAELTLKALKVRDAERPAPLHLVRRRVTLNESNGHGEPATSCVIESDRRTRADREAEIAARVERDQRETDLPVLRAIRDHALLATSYTKLGAVLNMRKETIGDIVSRLVRRGWVQVPDRERQPYTITPAGAAALEQGGGG